MIRERDLAEQEQGGGAVLFREVHLHQRRVGVPLSGVLLPFSVLAERLLLACLGGLGSQPFLLARCFA